jgi:hypothetical protein
MLRLRTREDTPTSGSQTITATDERTTEEEPVVLHLQVVSNADERKVTWDEEVIDNENMGKKSSKGMLLCFELTECAVYTINRGCLAIRLPMKVHHHHHHPMTLIPRRTFQVAGTTNITIRTASIIILMATNLVRIMPNEPRNGNGNLVQMHMNDDPGIHGRRKIKRSRRGVELSGDDTA